MSTMSKTPVKSQYNTKNYNIRNETSSVLTLVVDGVQNILINPNDNISIQINQTTTVDVKFNFMLLKTVRLYTNDTFNNLVLYSVGQSVQYKLKFSSFTDRNQPIRIL